jgi:hypothetical protein
MAFVGFPSQREVAARDKEWRRKQAEKKAEKQRAREDDIRKQERCSQPSQKRCCLRSQLATRWRFGHSLAR